MKKVWFVSHYSMPPQYEMRIKTQMYAHYLNKIGFDTKIFSASTIHNTDINLIKTKELYIEDKYDDLNFVHIKCSNYSGNGLQRIKNMQEFAFRFRRVGEKFELPDVVVADVNCTNYKPIYWFCKKYKIPMYIEVRDLWPMSIVEYCKGFSERNLIIKYLYHEEKKMYKRVDGVIFSIPGGKDYIIDKGWDKQIDMEKIYYINNGIDYNDFCQKIYSHKYVDEELDDPNYYKVIYTGSIRTANHIEPLIRAAQILQKYSEKKIKIFLFGDGDECERLKSIARNENIQNVSFKGSVKKKFIPNILSRADMCILNYKKSNTLRYGGSQNKLFEYLAIGKPILMTVDMNYNIVTENNLGLVLKEPTPEAIASGIIKISKKSEYELMELENKSKKIAQDYDYKILTDKLIDILTN